MSSAIRLLKSYQLTVTPQRVEIVNLFSSHGHLSIDTLYSFLQKSFPSLSLATVYKNINLMLEKNFVTEVQLENNKNVYELKKDEHSHVTCKECHEIVDIFLDTMSLYHEVAKISQFRLETSNIVFQGVCPRCLA